MNSPSHCFKIVGDLDIFLLVMCIEDVCSPSDVYLLLHWGFWNRNVGVLPSFTICIVLFLESLTQGDLYGLICMVLTQGVFECTQFI